MFLAGNPAHERELLDDLVERWSHPNQAIVGLQEHGSSVWHAAGETTAAPGVRIGPLWLGHGAGGTDQRCLVGPAWAPDRAEALKAARVASLREIADVEIPEFNVDVSMQPTVDIAPPGQVYRAIKRAFDIALSAAALTMLLPVMIVVGVAVWVESGWPLFFGHDRQGCNGRVFKCWKFRTMRRDALKMARMLADQNQCDGPQVNIRNDPRITRVGHFLRRTNLDELPQFWNVLVGDMSLVGPRPSPDDENQYCPAWRDLRLSVRPGITGLWQLKRTREPGEDFQEWIKYDIEYVQKASLEFDFMILVRTAILVLRGRASSAAE
jgi:lipopolysaccharide/colanic/teichoic acid biosynthesis glycosyltransferase